MSTSIYSGGLATKDPNSEEVVKFNWDDDLAVGVEIATSAFTISGPDAALTKDNETLVTGNRQTTLRLIGGTAGKKYKVTNRIETDEVPAQTKDASFTVSIAHK